MRETPTGGYARRIWFLYEWLTGTRLELPDATAGRYVSVVDTKLQFAGEENTEPHYRVKSNLPGTPDFCPLVFRTESLKQLIALDLAGRARDVVAEVPRGILARTAAFLLLKDSRSSYAIEGESAPQDRVQRWGRAHWASRPAADRYGRTRVLAEDCYRRCTLRDAWFSG